jgi:hypothetical protein
MLPMTDSPMTQHLQGNECQKSCLSALSSGRFTSYCVGLVSLYALADFLHRANRPGFEMTPKSWTI